jgi:pimeloyl-ACP methyl ester carboxylesterase
VQSGYLTAPGADLYYERRGDGPPLLLVVGGGGDCGYFAAMADRLASTYTVLTYDRRGNSRSRLHADPVAMDMAQQSDDAIAVLRANGFASSRVFGNGGGATIALDLLARYPRRVRAAVVYEPPVPRVLPDPVPTLAICDDVECCLATDGWRAAFTMFQQRAGGIEPDGSHPLTAMLEPQGVIASGPAHDLMRRVSQNREYAMRYELYSFLDYLPDFDQIAAGNARVALGAGAGTADEAAAISVETAERLGVECVQFSGGHAAPFELPAVFARELAHVFERL